MKRKRSLIIAAVFIVIGGTLGVMRIAGLGIFANKTAHEEIRTEGVPSWIQAQYLTKNEFSRPGFALDEVKNIVVHYVANPGTTAANNRNYFESLKSGKSVKASSHFIVGLDGEVLQCIPLSEVAYANYPRNEDTISIEVCHPDDTGKFNAATYDSVIRLAAWLCKSYGLTEESLLRHFDISGKDCPRYFVQNEAEWEQFKKDVGAQIIQDEMFLNQNNSDTKEK